MKYNGFSLEITHNPPSFLYLLHFGFSLGLFLFWSHHFPYWLLWLSSLLPRPLCLLTASRAFENCASFHWRAHCSSLTSVSPYIIVCPHVKEPKSALPLVICQPCISDRLHLCCPPLPTTLLITSKYQGQVTVSLHPWRLYFKPNHPVPNCPIEAGSVFVWIAATRKCSDKNLNTNILFGSYRKHSRGVQKRGREEKQPIKGVLSSQFPLWTTGA